jgi:hypothetical protein
MNRIPVSKVEELREKLKPNLIASEDYWSARYSPNPMMRKILKQTQLIGWWVTESVSKGMGNEGYYHVELRKGDDGRQFLLIAWRPLFYTAFEWEELYELKDLDLSELGLGDV